MLIYNTIKPDIIEKSSCALGMFDGVHPGHQEVISSAKKMSEVYNCPCVVVSFATHPQFVTTSTPTPLLTTLEDRLEMFEKLGADIALILEFDREFQQISAEEYINKILIGSLHAKSITIGYDHHFGRGKRGNQFMLMEYAEDYDYAVQIVPPISIDGQIISSSIIRKMIIYGDIALANKLLGRYFNLRGTVETGAKRGRELGYPTANVKPAGNIITPGCGVYSIELQIEDSPVKYPALLNIGYRPTFADRHIPVIEAYILDFNCDIYNKQVNIIFKSKIRDEKKFNSVEDLIAQINKDVESVRQSLKNPTILAPKVSIRQISH